MKSDYTQLLIDIQRRSNISVESVRDIKNLKEEIELVTGSIIGFNTLRRLFGFLPKTSPSTSTLNCLAQYLGFLSFSNYLNKRENFNEWYIQQKLIKIQMNNANTNNDLEIFKSALHNKNNIVSIAHTISFFIQKEDCITLEKIFNILPIQLLSDSELLKLATIVTFQLKILPPDKSLNIYSTLIKCRNFKDSIPLYYVDYVTLNGIYTKVLNIISNNSIEQSDLLFVELMHFYRSFLSSENYSNFSIQIPSDFKKFHPVLKGRHLAYLIMKSENINPKLENYLYSEYSSNKINGFIQEPMVALILKEKYQVLAKIFDKFYESIFDADSWYSKTTISISLIGLANSNWHSNSIQIAKKNLELIELDKIELSYFEYVSLLYYLTQLKISYAEGDIETNKQTYENIKHLVLETGFLLFLSKADAFVILPEVRL